MYCGIASTKWALGAILHSSSPEAIAYKDPKSLFKARMRRLLHTVRSMCLQHSCIKVISRWLKTPQLASSEKWHASEKNYHHCK